MSSVECRGCRAVSAVSAVSTVSIDWGVGPRGTRVLGPLVGKRGPSCPYISAQSPSPRMFLKNLRQRIVQYYIKIEPCHAKVFRPTMVQRLPARRSKQMRARSPRPGEVREQGTRRAQLGGAALMSGISGRVQRWQGALQSRVHQPVSGVPCRRCAGRRT